MWEEKRGTLAFSSVHLHCNPDFPMFDPFSLCKFESVARLLTNTSLIQSFRTFLSYSTTVTQIQHEKEESKQRKTNSIKNFFYCMKNRMQLKPPQLILTWRSLEPQTRFLVSAQTAVVFLWVQKEAQESEIFWK